jgi:hypothetical protein
MLYVSLWNMYSIIIYHFYDKGKLKFYISFAVLVNIFKNNKYSMQSQTQEITEIYHLCVF